jgi:hypothetical protein
MKIAFIVCTCIYNIAVLALFGYAVFVLKYSSWLFALSFFLIQKVEIMERK